MTPLRPFARAQWLINAAAIGLFVVAAMWQGVRAQQQQPPQQQAITPLERGRAENMLGGIHEELKKNYYDPTFHGIDVDARYKTYLERLKKAPTLGEAFRVIAAYLSGLDDSHTFFKPPQRSYSFDYGYQMQMVGEQCFITDVRPGSDAEKKLHPGDQVLSLGKFSVNRKDLWQLEYYLKDLAPTPATDFTLRDPAGNTRHEQVLTKYVTKSRLKDLTRGGGGGFDGYWDVVLQEEQQYHLLRERYVEVGDLLIWKMPVFVWDEAALGSMIDRARKHKALILDLRGNPGGYESALKFMAEGLFDQNVKIARKIMRKQEEDLVTKSRGHSAFTGQLIVLVDSRSASAAELFARVVQLEHRGTVVGDATSGSVMEAIYQPLQLGMGALGGGVDWDAVARGQGSTIQSQEEQTKFDTLVLYGASITRADLIMTDGKSLEKVGVTPDVLVLPTGADMAGGRDPVLAKAAELAGVKLDPAQAGKMFPFEWAPL
jgi:C-terminal processing protease CtpA/Prc